MDSGDNVRDARDALRNSFDPRVERTRAAILAAVRTLADAGEELTVSAIGRNAGVSRATFYAHYGGLDGLARAVWQEAFVAIDDLYHFDVHTTPDAVRLAYERLVQHFAEHRSLYAAAAALPVSKASYLMSVRGWAEIIEQSMDEYPRRPGMQSAAVARFVAGAIYGLLEAWVSGEIDLTETELVDHLTVLLPAWRGVSP
ncbi:MAG: TetR/AcrR family transcriptional regulator [Aeromicrobium sp.]